MAKNGLSTFLYSPLSSESPLTYGAVAKLGGAIQAEAAINYNDAKIYSDNRLKHKDGSFSDGTITLTTDYASKTIFSPLLGRTVKTESFTPSGGSALTVSKHVSNINDVASKNGFGYIVTDFNVDTNEFVYSVKFFYHVEFSAPTEDENTKQGARTFAQSKIIGTIYELENGDWCEESDFSTLPAAIEYLYHLFGGTYGADVNLSALTIGTLTLTPAFNVNTVVYMVDTTNASDAVTVTKSAAGATLELTINGTAHTSGTTKTWTSGLNEVKAVVTNGTASKTYTVFVEKS